MMRGMFSAISGLKQHQVMLDVTANDISNVNTIGYKSARVTFQDSLNQLQRGAAGANTNTGGTNAAQVGLGVKLGSIDVDAVTLFESRPAAGGVHYSPLMQTPLAPSRSAV